MSLPNPINRESLGTNLLDRYARTPRLGGDIGTARYVGTSRAATDFINGTSRYVSGNDVHSRNFRLFGQVPGFTRAADRYSRDVMGHDNTEYARGSAGFGRRGFGARVSFRIF